MKIKKIAGVALAGAMVFSLAAPVFATTTDTRVIKSIEDAAELEVTGKFADMIISVTLPSRPTVILNPYKISVDMDASEAGSDIQNGQILTPDYEIINNSNVALSMDVTATGTVNNKSVKLVGESTASITDGSSSVFMYLELSSDYTLDADTKVVTWESTVDADANAGQLVLTTTKQTKNDMVEMAAAVFDADGAVTEPGMAWFKLDGDAVSDPTTPWTVDHTVGATLAFTFNPMIPEDNTP